MLRVLLVGGCLLLPALSFGASAPKEIVIDDPDLIEGRTDAPTISDVTVRPGAEFDSVIPVRENFDDKVLCSVSEL